MNIYLKKSLADLWERKRRTLLVVCALFIAVFGLTCINTSEDALFSAFAFSVGNQADQADILLAVDTLKPAVQFNLMAISNTRAVQYETTLETLWHVARAPGFSSLKIISYSDLHHPALPPFELIAGRYPRAGEIVLEFGDQALQPITIGDKVTIDTLKGPTSLRVVGFTRTPGINPAISDKAQGYMSDEGIQQIAAFTTPDHPNQPTRLHFIAVKVESLQPLDATAQEFQRILQAHQVQVQLMAFPAAAALPLQQFTNIFSLLRLLLLLTVVLSALLIFMTITTLITEQTALIGTMKALGGTRRQVMRSYLLTIGLYSLLATVPGTLLGLLCGFQLATMIAASIPLAPSPWKLPPESIPLALALGCGLPLLVSLPPIWNGCRITVRQALSSYGIHAPTGATPGLLTRLSLPWPSQVAAFGLRSLLRRRWPVLLLLCVLSSTGISFFVVQTLNSSINTSVGSVYSRFNAQLEVDLENASYRQVRSQLASLPDVKRIERYGTSGASTRWGRIVLWGFDPDTRLYHYHLTSGRWLRNDDTNALLLSNDFAARSGLHVGDRLTLTGQNHASATWTIIGTVQQPVDGLGQVGAAVLPVNALYRFIGLPDTAVSDAAMRLLIQTQDQSPGAINQLATRIGEKAHASGGEKGSGITSVFLLRDESVRHQRGWFGVYGLFYSIALLIGLAGLLSLANELGTSVLERQREIGILRALGGRAHHIILIFWVQGLTLGLLAWFIGALLGVPLAATFVSLFSSMILPVSLNVDPLSFIIMFGAILLLATPASIIPAQRASTRRIAPMLHYE